METQLDGVRILWHARETDYAPPLRLNRTPVRGLLWQGHSAGIACVITTAAGAVSIQTESNMHFLWTILIGFVAGIIAKWIHPGSNEPSGFILTTILGIVGAFVATYLGQAVGWYKADQGAGFIGAIVGAVIILTIWSIIDRWRRTA